MYARLTTLLALAMLALPGLTEDSAADWSSVVGLGDSIPAQVIVDPDQLREFVPTGELVGTRNRGALEVESRDGLYPDPVTGENLPASITVRYRNRLLAAASAYRLGSALTANGITIDGWSDTDGCAFTRWVLEFAGERLEVTTAGRFRTPRCAEPQQ